jgi:hypothetical protein
MAISTQINATSAEEMIASLGFKKIAIFPQKVGENRRK